MIIPWFTVLNKVSSLAIGVGYVIADRYMGGSSAHQLKIGICLLIVLGLIWFGDQLGSFTGCIGRGGNIDVETPGWMVCAMGWFLLLGIPAVQLLINRG